MVLPKKVSRKLRKTNKNVKKNNKTRKNLKGSGYGKGKRPTTTEEEIARLGNMFNINNTGLNNELYKLNLETDEEELSKKITKNQNFITKKKKYKEK